MTRGWVRAAFLLSPPLFLLVLYEPTLRAWFRADDFAWLAMARSVHDWNSFLHAMWFPVAQGTLRFWSERGFFILFYSLFGLNAIPWHAFVLLSACGVALLLQQVTLRLTASPLAAWLAPLIWIASTGLPIDLTWISAYNEILCPLFLLAAFNFRLHHAWKWELLTFVLGFGALELNVVYPAIALVWVLISRDRPRFRRDLLEVAGLALISAAYLVLRSLVVSPVHTGPYVLHFDREIASTFRTYWEWLIVSPQWDSTPHFSATRILIVILIFTFGLLFLAVREKRVALFGLAWFALTLGPLLPLRDHVTDYYLAIPAVGTSLAAAAGVAFLRVGIARGIALAMVATFICAGAVAGRQTSGWWVRNTRAVRTLVLGAQTAQEKHPGEAILIDGIDSDIYGASFADDAFKVVDVPSVYLSPETLSRIHTPDYLQPLSHYVLPPGPTIHALASDQLVVYRLAGDRLQNITSLYAAGVRGRLPDRPPTRVDVANPLLSYLLGPGWFPLEGGHRWMGQTASLLLDGPSPKERQLVLSGDCPAPFVRTGPLTVEVRIDGHRLPPVEITRAGTPFHLEFPVPPNLSTGAASVIQIELSRTTVLPSDSRHLGLAFGTIEFLP